MEGRLEGLLGRLDLRFPSSSSSSAAARSLRCARCRRLLLDPKQTSCGHLFCSLCLSALFASKESAVCPLDDRTLTKDEIFKDANAKRQVYQLQVHCPNEEFGCSRICRLQDLVEHVDACDWKSTVCPQGCELRLLSNQLMEHLQNCTHRHVSCDYCTSDVVVCKMKDHLEECPLIPIPCPFQCKTSPLIREQMTIHIKSCSKKPINCKFAPLGCKFQGTQEMVDAHELDSKSHLELFLTASIHQTAYFNATLSELKAEIKELQNENIILKDQMTQTGELHQYMKLYLEQLTKRVAHLQQLLLTMDNTQGPINANSTQRRSDSALYEELKTIKKTVEHLEQKLRAECVSTGNLEDSSLQHENQLSQHSLTLAELNQKFQKLEMTSNNGVLMWKICDFSRRKQDAMRNHCTSLYSIPFYSNEYGYKMCAQLFPYGNEGTSLSIYLIVMKSKLDAVLKWPFQPKLTFMLLDQKKGTNPITVTENGSCFPKPTKDRNQSIGLADFVPLNVLESSDCYLVNDTVFIKVIVDNSK